MAIVDHIGREDCSHDLSISLTVLLRSRPQVLRAPLTLVLWLYPGIPWSFVYGHDPSKEIPVRYSFHLQASDLTWHAEIGGHGGLVVLLDISHVLFGRIT